MTHVRVNATVVIDRTGIKVKIPIILITQQGRLKELEPLLDYFLAHYQAKSLDWMLKLCQIVGLLMDYTATNHQFFGTPEDLFETFAQRIYAGTIGEDGLDPSGLYWLPKRTKTARQLLTMLSQFSDWMQKNYGTKSLNPWREATHYEQQLNWAAFVNKSERSFLGHLDSRAGATAAARQARNVLQRRVPTADRGETKSFPDDCFLELLFVGFTVPGKQDSPDIVERYDWRGICITILMHWGGLRVSEPFHLWVHDVVADPLKPNEALVRVYHPIDGAAPNDFRYANGKLVANREAYLRARHPGYLPRHKETGNRRAGWKDPKLDDGSQNYLHVHWLPAGIAGRLFFQAWKLYMYQRMRARIGADKHPFLFVSFRGDQRGEPYTIDAYRDAHERAVRRIGLRPAKMNGTTEHGHRHAYGQRTQRAKVDALVTQKGLHHKSIESQAVYTEPSIDQVTRALEATTATLDAGRSVAMADVLDAFLLAERKNNSRPAARKGIKL
ncbi:gamma-mobile-trio recombinase GmtY [Paraburkholderia sp. BCC1884]|uniref:gamma-mobile-trio recombinase GmtY n=1 Tax=Paraburkholderia sp. BCC1884 TaxID=2562668 RepID=UPI0011832778|nr:gamma-mobile-trio recombinase GmtY [Paraburkholderia sp. BCC1884]